MLQLVIVIIPPSEVDLVQAVRRLMAPHTAREVEPYKEYWSEEEFVLLKQRYPGEAIHQWLDDRQAMGIEAGVDEEGYFEWRSLSPDAWFDGWVVGGSWDGALANAAMPADGERGPSHLEGNACPVIQLPPASELLPHAVVTPDGRLHAHAKTPWQDGAADPDWAARVQELYATYPDHTAILVEGRAE